MRGRGAPHAAMRGPAALRRKSRLMRAPCGAGDAESIFRESFPILAPCNEQRLHPKYIYCSLGLNTGKYFYIYIQTQQMGPNDTPYNYL
jgi:hypothetical protein